MSAVVVPTAADLANGVVFSLDRVMAAANHGGSESSTDQASASNRKRPVWIAKYALSLDDLGGYNISEFNRLLARCFAEPGASDQQCTTLTFDDMLPG